MNVMDFLRGLGSSVASNNPVTMAIDTGANIADLGIAAAGYVGHKTGMLSTDQLPEPLERSAIPGSSAWLDKQAGVNDSTAATVGSLAGMFVQPGKAASKVFGDPEKLWGKDYADKMKKIARGMLQTGKSKEEVWKATGLYRTPDKTAWIGELADTGMTFKVDPNKMKLDVPHSLSDVVDLPQFSHIPELQAKLGKVKVEFVSPKSKKLGGALAMYDDEANVIYVSPKRGIGDFYHEFQHALDRATDGTIGASLGEWQKKFGDIHELGDRYRYNRVVQEIGLAKKGSLDEEMAIESLINKGYTPDEIQKHLATRDEMFFGKVTKDDLKVLAEDTRMIDARIREAAKQQGKLDAQSIGQTPDLVYGSYGNIAGEALARATDARRGMTMAERLEIPPWQQGYMDLPKHLDVTDPDLLDWKWYKDYDLGID